MGKKTKSGAEKKTGNDGGNEDDGVAAVKAIQDEVAQLNSIYEKRLRAERLNTLEQMNERFVSDTLTLKEKLREKHDEHTEMLRYMEEKDKEKDSNLKTLEHEKKRTADDRNELVKEFDKLREKDNTHWELKVKQLEEKVHELQRKYDETSDFRTEKSSILGKLEEARKALLEEKHVHATDVADLDRRNIAAKERLKKEMLRKIKETKLSLLAMTEDQLHTTTKRTIMENEQMTIELQYQSKETEKLLAQNAKLQAENTRMRRQIELHLDTETMLGTRTHYFQRTVKRLNEQIAFLEEGQRSVDDSTQRSKGAEREAIVQLHDEIDRRKETQNLLQEAYNEADTLRSELREVLSSHESMTNLQDESVAFVWACLEDTRRTAGLEPTKPLHEDVEMLMKRGKEQEKLSHKQPVGEPDENGDRCNKVVSSAKAKSPFRLARPIKSLKEANAEDRAALLELFLTKLRNFQHNHQSLLHALEANNIRRQTISPLLARDSPAFSSTQDLLRSRQICRGSTNSKLSFSSTSSTRRSQTKWRSQHLLRGESTRSLADSSATTTGSSENSSSTNPKYRRRPLAHHRGDVDVDAHRELVHPELHAATGRVDPTHPLREWGKRADTIPLKVGGPKLFLKKNHRNA